MVADFKKRGIPINGIGIQMHITTATPNEGITNAFKQFAATGLQIHIAELDIRVNINKDTALTYTPALQKAQADKYAFVANQYKTLIPKGQQFGITTWNVGDDDSWIRHFYNKADWPLLFDDSYAKKQVYYSFLTALKK
jgi:endo-1,4-beta-xylanase